MDESAAGMKTSDSGPSLRAWRTFGERGALTAVAQAHDYHYC